MLTIAIPAPAASYPGSVTAFEDGATGGSATLRLPLQAALLGTVVIPSNATVVDASVTLSGAPTTITGGFTDDGTAGFPSGTWNASVDVSSSGISLALRQGSTVWSGAGLDAGTFSGTTRTSAGVVLSGTTGSYTSPSLPWDGTSFGRLIADYASYAGSTVSFSLVDGVGTVLQAGVVPGAHLSVDGDANPHVYVKVEFTAGSPGVSPQLKALGAGYEVSHFHGTSSASSAIWASSQAYGPNTELRENPLQVTENPSNPLITPTPSTWHAIGPLTGGSVAVGAEVWMYVYSQDGGGAWHIGRMVSSDGGYTWAIDSTPMLNTTASSWDSAFVGAPTVVREADGSFMMWYMGAASGDVFSIGLATSADGISWTKFASNPVLTKSNSGWDNYNAGWPTVEKVGSQYTMFFGARPTTDARKSIGYATSADGQNWTKYGSNPVIAWGSTSYGNYDLAPADAWYEGATWYLLWTCGASSTDYDSCISTSSNRNTWSHASGNPIITTDDGTWDSITAESAQRVVDPATGHSLIWFMGRPSTASYSLGYATPHWLASGSVTLFSDLSSEVPRSFLWNNYSASTPAQTSVVATLSTSTTNASYSAPEAVGATDGTVQTLPSNWLRQQFSLSTADTNLTPALRWSRVTYDRYAVGGTFTSAPFGAAYVIVGATVLVSSTQPAGTSVGISVSNDGGATWVTATSGVAVAFATQGSSFSYQLDLTGRSNASPTVDLVQVSLTMESLPGDVTLRDADGSLQGSLSGPLASAAEVALDEAYFNSKIAPVAASDPPQPVYFDLWVNGTAPGVVSVVSLSFNLTFPDALRTYFSPPVASVRLDVGEAQNFLAAASTTPGVDIGYAWKLDGVAAGSDSPTFAFSATGADVGMHTVSVNVTNGQFTAGNMWTIEVVEVPIFFTGVFFPSVADLDIPAGTSQSFVAGATNGSLVTPTITWILDGAAAGDGTTYTYEAPALAGDHTLEAQVTDGVTVSSFTWTIHVADVPGAVSHTLQATFTPAGAVEIAFEGTASLSAQITSPPPDVTYRWFVDGTAISTDTATYSFDGMASGAHMVSVVASNATAVVAHTWEVLVGPAPLPAAPTVSIGSPEPGATRNTSVVRVTGTATPNTQVSVNGVATNASSSGEWAVDVGLFAGANTLTATVRDSQGRTATASVTVNYSPPQPPGDGGGDGTGAGDTTMYIVAIAALAAVAGLMALLWSRERGKGPRA